MGLQGRISYAFVQYLAENGIWTAPELSAWIYDVFMFREFGGPYRDSLLLAWLLSWILSVMCMVHSGPYTTALAKGITELPSKKKILGMFLFGFCVIGVILVPIPLGRRSIVDSFSLGMIWFFIVTPGRAIILVTFYKRYILRVR